MLQTINSATFDESSRNISIWHVTNTADGGWWWGIFVCC